MTKNNDILSYLDSIAPLRSAESYDNVGLLVGSGDSPVGGICCCLDITDEIIREAAAKGASLIVAHHPVIFHPLKKLPTYSVVYRLIENGISAICVHTNFDICEGGVNDTLVELLEMERSEPLTPSGYGAVCELPFCFTPKTLAEHCQRALDLECVRYSRAGGDSREIRRAAVCCGSGVDGEVMELALEKGCGAIISGDIKHSCWIEAQACGIALVDAGHYGTERAFADKAAMLLTKAFPHIPVFAADSQTDPCCVTVG